MNPFIPTLEPVWDSPTCVWLNPEATTTTAARIALEEFPMPAWREAVFPEDDTVFLDFIGVGNAINFAFTDFETHQSFIVEYEGKEWRGAFAMWAALRRALHRGMDVLAGDFLRTMSLNTLSEVFAGESPIPLIDQRLLILQEVGRILCARYQGRFRNVLLSGNNRAFGNLGVVTRLLEEFPSFRDESVHRKTGSLLKFEKRAQLLAMMYHGRAFSSQGLRPLIDFEDLGPIADYGVPRALHALGILTYAPKLEKQITARDIIERDSVAEQEIRAQTVQAQLRLLEAINRRRSERISYAHLDYKLWMMGRIAREPHHLTRTTAY
jgi:Queuosine salvage protein